jgi:hypothetical protein
MMLSNDIKTIIIKYEKPYIIRYMSEEKKRFFGICLDNICFNNFNLCENCMIHFNIVYNIRNNISIIPNINIQENKIYTYYLFKYILKNLNFRFFNTYNLLYFEFLVNFRYDLSTYHININYKTLFLFFLIFNQDKKNIFV